MKVYLKEFLLGQITLIFAFACFALAPQARAVCREGCDLGSSGATFLGEDALISNSGINNTAVGFNALFSNTTGEANTATGFGALFHNTTASFNTAIGNSALNSNTTGHDNTATGDIALIVNETGNYNTATGSHALEFSSGHANTATGSGVLQNNTGGSKNTADGANALLNNTTGNRNIALGFRAGINLTTGDGNIDIGNAGVPGESSTIRIGTAEHQSATFIAGISGATVPTGVAVIVDADGHLGTSTSSARFKEAVRPMEKESEAILALKPVTFRYKKDLDPDGIPQFGLVAEEVEKVNPDLVARDEQGKAYTVRYEAVNAMLLNEFLKEHHKVQTLEAKVVQQEKNSQTRISEQQREIDLLKAALKEQAATIQKISERVKAGEATLSVASVGG